MSLKSDINPLVKKPTLRAENRKSIKHIYKNIKNWEKNRITN